MSSQQQTVIFLKYPELKCLSIPNKLPGPFHFSSQSLLAWDPHYSCVLLCGYLICLTPVLDISF